MGHDITRGYSRSMGGTRSGGRARSRPKDGTNRPAPKGSIDTLPSGSLRVRVYAGTDVLTGKPHYVGEVIKPGPHARELAEEATPR